MKGLIWMPRAEGDLAAIQAYIANDHPLRAQAVVRRIIRAADRAATFPGAGRMVPEQRDPSVREVFVYSYRIVYLVLEKEIHILTIHHGARMLDDEELR